ncbi:type II TA system antitoxin MqsA family protein [Chloroflexota bacterium]
MKKQFCPICEEYHDTSVSEKKSTYKVKGDSILINEQVRICGNCSSIIFDEKLDSENLLLAYTSYREKNSLLQSSDIKRIRQKYGLSQRSFSRLLGWGDISVHRYENGAIQDKAHDSILRFVEKPSNLQELFNVNKGLLPAYVSSSSEQILSKLLQEEQINVFQTSFENLITHKLLDSLSGYKEYDFDKFRSMIVYLVNKLNGVLITKLNKLLWYCDFLSFKETTLSISGSRYLCHQYGPVPENYDLIIDIMTCDFLGNPRVLDKREIVFNAQKGIIGDEFISLVEPDLSVFTKLELDIFDYVCEEFCDYSSSQIKERSHKETGFIKCGTGDFISYEFASDLSISLTK